MLCLYVCMYMGMICICHSTHIEVSQFSLSTCGSQGLNLGHQTQQQVPLPTEPSYWPESVFKLDVCLIPIISTSWRLKQEDYEFETTLSYTANTLSQITTKN